MIGLDTNVIIRYVVQDDPRQSKRANHWPRMGQSVPAPGSKTLVWR